MCSRGTQQDIFNVMGALYAAVLFLGVNNASSVQPVVAVERSVFYRERAAGMYSPLPYAFAQVCINAWTGKCYLFYKFQRVSYLNILGIEWCQQESAICYPMRLVI